MTGLQPFDPFCEMRHFSRLMSHALWTSRWGDPLDDDVERANETWSTPMDVRRDDKPSHQS